MYDSDSLAALRQKIDLVALLQTHLNLKRAGSVYRSLCPFHDEKSPSFMIKSGDSHFHCFGCGAHGDGIDFLMRFLGLSFSQSVETLAESLGVHLEKQRAEQEDHLKGTSRRRLKDCLGQAARFFHFWLLASQEGEQARQYLLSRQIDKKFIERFQIGLAPERGGILRRFLRDQTFSEKEMKMSGLISEGGREFFLNRILFPIKDPLGHPIAFSGRKFHDETFGGKYINSPDTPLFRKSNVLFGLSESRRQMAKERRAVIVEGQLDTLRLIEAGLAFACAPLGTAFAEGHVQQLQKLGVNSAILVFDGDAAGHQATEKTGHLCLKHGLDVRVVSLPEGVDPDALICSKGLGAFEKFVEKALDFVDYLFHKAGDWSLVSPAAKQGFLKETVHEICQWQQPILVHESLRRLAYLANIPQSALMSQLSKKAPYTKRKAQTILPTKEQIKPFEPEKAIETEFIASLLHLLQRNQHRAWLDVVQRALSVSDLWIKAAAKAYQLIEKLSEKESSLSLSTLIEASQDQEVIQLFQEIGEKKSPPERIERQMESSISTILRRNWMMRREMIKKEIQSGVLSDEIAMQKAGELAKMIASPPTSFQLPKDVI